MTILCTRGATHEYCADGINLFSVSQVRRIAHDPYRGIPEDVLAAAQRRGTLLHKRFWRVLAAQAGLLAMPPVLVGLEGYCQSMDEWAKRTQVRPITFEATGVSLKFGYAGTPDAKVFFAKKKRVTLLDLKTGAPTATDPMQLLAYQKLDGYDDAVDLLDLYIQKDGSYAVEEPVTARVKVAQWSWFMSALGVLQSRVNAGVK